MKRGAFCAAGRSPFFRLRRAKRSSFPGQTTPSAGPCSRAHRPAETGPVRRAAAPIQGRCAACRKKAPLFCVSSRCPLFCCAGPSYAPQAPIVQPARLWYNKTLRDTLYRENDFYAYHHTAGHRCYHAAAGPGAFGCVCSLRRSRPALGLRRGDSGSGTPGRREPDAGGCHLPDPLPWRPHLWSAGPFADSGGAGPHKAACAAGSGGPAGYLGGGAGTDRCPIR